MSKTHTLGVGFGIDGNKPAHGKDRKVQDQGLSLRFPRFVRQRQDKAFRLPVQHFLDAAITQRKEASNEGEPIAKVDEDEAIGTSVEEILRMYDPKKFS